MNDDKPDLITRDPVPVANAAEIERMEIVRRIQQQTTEANAERVRLFGPPKYQPSQQQRLAERHTVARNIKLGGIR